MKYYMCSEEDDAKTSFDSVLNCIEDPIDSDRIWYWDGDEDTFRSHMRNWLPIAAYDEFEITRLNDSDGIKLYPRRLELLLLLQQYPMVIEVRDDDSFVTSHDTTKYIEVTHGDFMYEQMLYVHSL